MNRFINLLSLSWINGSSNRKGKATITDTEKDTGTPTKDRAVEERGIGKGYRRRIAEKARQRRFVCSMQSVYGRFRNRHEKSQRRKGTCIKRKERQDRRRRTKAVIFPSFLFSYQSLLILQSLDDICFQINPILIGELLRWH